ncbi:MAG: phosphatase PAP2 family protein [Candidatus Helarchaeota archaeon]
MSGLILVLPLKQAIKRTRPFNKIQDIKVLEQKPESLSFPSWHTYNITAQGILVSYLLKSPLILIIMLLFAALVSFSRIQIGVHYPSDVIVGYLLGIVGFVLSALIFTPLFLRIIDYLEQFATHKIYYRELSGYLFEEWWYILICVGVFGGIIFSGSYKMIRFDIKKI